MLAKRLPLILAAVAIVIVYLTWFGTRTRSVSVQQQPTLLPGEAPRAQAAPAPAPTPKPSAPVDASVEKALRARVNEYWRLRTKSDLLGAYKYYEPSFRAQYTPQDFLLKFQRLVRFKPQFLGIERIRFEPGGRAAAVFIQLRTYPEMLQGRELKSVTEETWLVSGELWCKKAEPLLPSF